VIRRLGAYSYPGMVVARDKKSAPALRDLAEPP